MDLDDLFDDDIYDDSRNDNKENLTEDALKSEINTISHLEIEYEKSNGNREVYINRVLFIQIDI